MRKSKRIEKKRDVSQKKQKNGGKEIMNKKRLSVVMAGAMLASSVAPVSYTHLTLPTIRLV